MRRRSRSCTWSRILHARGYQLFDIQQWTPHTGSMGAVEISRIEYLRRAGTVPIELPVTFGEQLARRVTQPVTLRLTQLAATGVRRLGNCQ